MKTNLGRKLLNADELMSPNSIGDIDRYIRDIWHATNKQVPFENFALEWYQKYAPKMLSEHGKELLKNTNQ